MSHNPIGDAGAISIAQNQTLRELFISYAHISNTGAMAFVKNSILTKLCLNYNYIEAKTKAALEQNKTLKSLQLSDEKPPEINGENLNITFFIISRLSVYL